MMTCSRVVWGNLVGLALAALVAAPAGAQTGASSIAGLVKDTTGAVLPGVTVEAASPALIEKVRTGVTDSEGQYKIIDVRPGLYTVTFTLPGFSTVRREGIELPANFTATVNAELRVGGVEETITVSGDAPAVDVHSTTQELVFSRAMLDALPAARQASRVINGYAAVKGTSEVGGTSGEYIAPGTAHGSNVLDTSYQLDGMGIQGGYGTGGNNYMFYLNNGSVQEMTVEVGGMSAESQTGGIRFNVIPKEGSNVFKGLFLGAYTNNHLQGDNLTESLIDRGVRNPNGLVKMWDINPGFGGPVVRDKLWFNAGFRHWGTYNTVAGVYYNLTPTGNAYTPDYSRPAPWNQYLIEEDLRLTWQAAPKHKINLFVGNEYNNFMNGLTNGGATDRSPEAHQYTIFEPNYVTQVSWSFPATNRLLLEAGGTLAASRWYQIPPPGVSPNQSSLTEQSTNFTIRASPSHLEFRTNNWNYRASVSYVTGSHTFKTGFFFMSGYLNRNDRVSLNAHPGSMNLFMLNGVPSQVTIWTDPIPTIERLKGNLALFTQDSWTRKRLTLNLGLRFETLNGYVPEQHLAAGRFIGARDFAPVYDTPNWKDLSPRMGAVYDLFGTGRTALKASLGRYPVGAGTSSITALANPVNASVNSANRPWTDRNGDFIPDCNFSDPAANGECGPLSNLGFGGTRILTRYSDDFREGFNVRPYNWESSVGVQHELLSGLGVGVAYFRRWYRNQRVDNNVLVKPTDYDPYCITAPTDARLGSISGQQVCGFVDINPAKFGQFNTVIERASTYGKVTENFNGIDVTVRARFSNGAQLSGGTAAGRSAFDACDMVAQGILPTVAGSLDLTTSAIQVGSQRFCHQETPFWGQTQVKLFGVYPLPWDLQASAMFQNLPGSVILASYVVTNAQVSPSLGRSLAGGARNATVNLISPGSLYEDRWSQLDVRLTRTFRVGTTSLQGLFDFFNLLNSSATAPAPGGFSAAGAGGVNTRYGPDWLKPLRTLPARMLKFGVQIDF